MSTRRPEIAPGPGSKAKAVIVRGPLSMRYIVRAVAAPPIPFGMVSPSSTCSTRPSGRAGRAHRHPRGGRRRGVPAQIRPCGSQAASFSRLPGAHDVGHGRERPVLGQVDEPAARPPAPSRRRPATGASAPTVPGTSYVRTGTSAAVVGDPVAVDPAGQDVDAQQLVAAGVPAGAFTELGLLGRAGDRLGHEPRALEVHDDLDVVRATGQRVGDVGGRDPAGDQPAEPVAVGGARAPARPGRSAACWR